MLSRRPLWTIRVMLAAALAVVLGGCAVFSSPGTASGAGKGAGAREAAVASAGGPLRSPVRSGRAVARSPGNSRPAAARSPEKRAPAAANASPRAVARAFVAAYARYLEGGLDAAALPDATTAVQTQAGPRIPAASRAGTLVVASLAPTSGQEGFAATLTDRAHAFPLAIALERQRSRWQVVECSGPDIDSIVHTDRTAIFPLGSPPAALVAREFLDGYLPWLFGHGPVTAIHEETPALRAALARPPTGTAAPPGLHGQLVALGMQRRGAQWLALANITTNQQPLSLSLWLAQTAGRWLVAGVQLTAGDVSAGQQ